MEKAGFAGDCEVVRAWVSMWFVFGVLWNNGALLVLFCRMAMPVRQVSGILAWRVRIDGIDFFSETQSSVGIHGFGMTSQGSL